MGAPVPAATTVAAVGLGAMGGRIAGRLVDAGCDVLVWNRSPARMRPLVDRGARPARSPAHASAGADVVVTMVSGPDALRSVTEGADGVAAGVRGGAAVIEMSTVGPAAVARLASVLPAGTGLVDAPVLGSIAEAEAGTLRIFTGGPAAAVERWTPLLRVLGTPVHVGPLGAGAAAKLVANSTLFGVLGILGEVVALGRGLGLPDEALFAVLAGTPLAQQARRRLPAIQEGAYPARFGLSLARKDAELIVQAAAAAGVELRLIPAVGSWLAAAERAGHGDADYSAVLAAILAASGRPAGTARNGPTPAEDRRGRGPAAGEVTRACG